MTNFEKFLLDSYEVEANNDLELVEFLTSVSNRTHFEVIEPTSLQVYSLLNEPNEDANGIDIIKLDPAYSDMRLFLPNKGESYFAPEKGNVGTMPYEAFLENGMTEEFLEELKTVGYFFQMTTEAGKKVTLIPTKGFLATLCRQLGVGKLEEGISPMRDIYLTSRFSYCEPFTLVYRTDKKFGKAFGCFSPNFGKTPQTVILKFKEQLMRNNPNISVRHWEYTHSITSVDFCLNNEIFKLGKMKVTPGVRLSLSDIGDSSYTLQCVLYCNGSVVTLPESISRKRSGELDVESMVAEFLEVCTQELNNLKKLVETYKTISVTNIGLTCVAILKDIGFGAAIGKYQSIEIFKNFKENESSGTLEDVVCQILKIPGNVKANNIRSCMMRVSASIGQIFVSKEMKKLCK